jgi:hypothetical protein
VVKAPNWGRYSGSAVAIRRTSPVRRFRPWLARLLDEWRGHYGDLDKDGNLVSMTVEHASKVAALPFVSLEEIGVSAV